MMGRLVLLPAAAVLLYNPNKLLISPVEVDVIVGRLVVGSLDGNGLLAAPLIMLAKILFWSTLADTSDDCPANVLKS
jgi:hypothetical protein